MGCWFVSMLEKLLTGWRHKSNYSQSKVFIANVCLHFPNSTLSVRPVWSCTHTPTHTTTKHAWKHLNTSVAIVFALEPEIYGMTSPTSVNWQINEGGCGVTESLKNRWSHLVTSSTPGLKYSRNGGSLCWCCCFSEMHHCWFSTLFSPHRHGCILILL